MEERNITIADRLNENPFMDVWGFKKLKDRRELEGFRLSEPDEFLSALSIPVECS
jgi:hypothetical protein